MGSESADFFPGSLLLVGGELGLSAQIQYEVGVEMMVESTESFVHTLQSHGNHIENQKGVWLGCHRFPEGWQQLVGLCLREGS